MSQKLWRAMATALIVIFWDISLGLACFLGVGALMLGAFRASLPTGGDPYFITGFASASFIWFSYLAIVVHALGSTINSHVLTWLNRICGAVIVLYGGEIAGKFGTYRCCWDKWGKGIAVFACPDVGYWRIGW